MQTYRRALRLSQSAFATQVHVPLETYRPWEALLHESSLARTMPTDRILTCRCDTTLVGQGRSSD